MTWQHHQHIERRKPVGDDSSVRGEMTRKQMYWPEEEPLEGGGVAPSPVPLPPPHLLLCNAWDRRKRVLHIICSCSPSAARWHAWLIRGKRFYDDNWTFTSMAHKKNTTSGCTTVLLYIVIQPPRLHFLLFRRRKQKFNLKKKSSQEK